MTCKIHPKYKGIRVPTSVHPECTCAALFKLRQHPLTAAQRLDRTARCQQVASEKRIAYLEKVADILRNRAYDLHELNCELVKGLSGAKATIEYLNAKVVRLEQETRNWSKACADQKREWMAEVNHAKAAHHEKLF